MRYAKAQQGILALIFSVIVTVILTSLLFSKWLTQYSQELINNNNLVGLEAFLVANVNIWLFIAFLILCLVIIRYA